MKKTLFTLVLIVLALNIKAQEKVNWISFEKAVELNKKNPKPFLIDIYTDWCGWCKKMDRETYTNPVIANYINKNYHAVKMNGEGRKPITYKGYTFKFHKEGRSSYHELTAALMNGKLSYPTTVFLDKNEKLMDRVPGYLDAKKMELILAFLNRKETNSKNFNEFMKNFKSKIEE